MHDQWFLTQHIDNLIGTQFGKKKKLPDVMKIKKNKQPTGVVTLGASVSFTG